MTLEELAAEIRSVLAADNTETGRRAVCAVVSKALVDPVFAARHLTDRTEGAPAREVLYEDPDLGFCICGHVYAGARTSPPHDHGSSWAIYGQAVGVSEMTDWTIVGRSDEDGAVLVSKGETYEMRPGDAHLYEVGAVHSPHWTEPMKLVRIEGANLDHVTRSTVRVATAADANQGA